MFYIIGSQNKTHPQGFSTNLLGLLLLLISLMLPLELYAQDLFSNRSFSQWYSEQKLNLSHLNNEQLLERAQHLRSNNPNTTQQTLNYQWLKAHQNDNSIVGKKVYQTLFKRGFKAFWNRQRKERFKSERIPDINGRGSVSNEVDYKLRLNSDELKVKLSYEF
jgi:hypothetical protein